MENFTLPTLSLPQTKKDDPRFFELLGTDPKADSTPKVVILGFPSDRGVELNGGRTGAAAGPTAIREQLYRLCPDPHHFEPFVQILKQTKDIGDLILSDDLEQDLERLSIAISTYIQQGAFVILLGGSHDLSLAHYRAYSKCKRTISVINMDAHVDVREPLEGKTHSGSPFFQAMHDQEFPLDGYTVWGLKKWACSKAQIDLLKQKKSDYYFIEQVSGELVQQLYTANKADRMATFDLDSIDQAFAPGVSAPATAGVSSTLFLQAMLEVGKNSTFSSVDLVELNPKYDRDNQSARLAAVGIWHLFSGLCSR